MKKILIFTTMITALLSCRQNPSTEPVPECFPSEDLITCNCLYKPGDYSSKFWRIPAILQLSDGTLLAVNDKRNETEEDLPGKIDVVCRYSTDKGKTWSDMQYVAKNTGFMHGYGDPGLAEFEDGTVICTFTSGETFSYSKWENPQRSFYALSHDHGRSWDEPVEITGAIWGPDADNPSTSSCRSSFTSSGNSLIIKEGPYKGRFIAMAVLFNDATGRLCNHAIFTDDGAKTWHVSDMVPAPCGDEAKVVQLNDGNLLCSIRNNGNRLWSISRDGGLHWEESREWADVTTCACNGDLIRYNDRILLHSVPDSNKRENVCVKVSYDEGKTWPVSKVICKGPSQYSSLTVLQDGTIAAFIEKNTSGVELWYLNFTLDWVEGK